MKTLNLHEYIGLDLAKMNHAAPGLVQLEMDATVDCR